MSPVCKNCRNYVMGFPCPHCGGEQALTDRESDEIKPIIPLDLQESFKEPPPPIDDSDSSSPPYQPPAPQHEYSPPPPQSPPTPPPPVTPPQTKLSYTPPPATTPEPVPYKPPPKEVPPQPPPPSVEQEIQPVSPPTPPKVSFTVSKDDSGLTVPLDEVKAQFKQIESHFKKIYNHQKNSDSQAKKFQVNFKDIGMRLNKIEKSLKILLDTNKKLESIHKDTSKDLKKVKL
ncbi:MAG: hypothetical protein JSW11_04970 [Candidatus Heimdallarchaeota archaeon]|nr:MAG: hypothetical protein JSW11_04970 [Candidatus Heimdallarchaeota archaeon]